MTVQAHIIDDGTLDTVVQVITETGETIVQRYSSDYRFSFDADTDFLGQVVEEVIENEEWGLKWKLFRQTLAGEAWS